MYLHMHRWLELSQCTYVWESANSGLKGVGAIVGRFTYVGGDTERYSVYDKYR